MKEKILKILKENNLSQRQLAEMVGVKQQYISKILLGKVESPSFKLVVKIADALNISLDEFR